MHESNRQQLTQTFLAIQDPPWFKNPPADFSAPTKIDVYSWFRQQPRPICILLTLNELKQQHDPGAGTFKAIALFEKHLAGKTNETEEKGLIALSHWRRLRGRTRRGDSCALNVREFFEVVFTEKSNSFLAYMFHNEMYTRWFIECEGRRQHSRRHPASHVWRSQSQQNVIKSLRNIFQPPAEFQPKSPDEWIIAADMLEEAGELRAQAIRAAVQGASDKELLAAICHARMSESGGLFSV